MNQRVLLFHYTLTNKQGEQIDTSIDGEPFPVLEGAKQILPELEKELFRMAVGDKKRVELTAEKAYGKFQQNLVMEVPRDKLPAGEMKEGMQFQGGVGSENFVFTVKKIEGAKVHLDGNHPLAGMDLAFDVEVVELRDASPEELKHGHAHGPHGHHHH